MDEDGFYMGELNGIRGLVPSNFLQLQSGNINTLMAPLSNSQLRPKGVAFSGEVQNNRRATPIRQSSQTSTTGKVPPSNNTSLTNFNKVLSSGNTSKSNKTMSGPVNVSSSNAMPNKMLIKKTSDLTNKSINSSNSANATSKKLQALKKADGGSGVKVKLK